MLEVSSTSALGVVLDMASDTALTNVGISSVVSGRERISPVVAAACFLGRFLDEMSSLPRSSCRFRPTVARVRLLPWLD